MIFYNWNVLKRETKDDPKKMLEYIKYVTSGSQRPKLQPYYIFATLAEKNKSSYLLNPRALLDNRYGGTLSDIRVYLELASRRNYMDYLTNNQHRYLYVYSVDEEYNLNRLHNNRLLSITDDKIYLKYEQELNYNGKSIR
jgi:hypothetical protein